MLDPAAEVPKIKIIACAIDELLAAAQVHTATAITALELAVAMVLSHYGIAVEDFAKRVEATRCALMAQQLIQEVPRG